jgi:hypothetical protein
MAKTCEEIISQNLVNLVDVSQENGKCREILQEIANADKSAVLAFIAPYIPVRVSPVETQSASIGLSEEFAILFAIEEIKAKKIDKLHFLINSPGGYVHSSYKIAKLLRCSFAEIKAYVPHLAASGGTLMALAANEVIMGPMSHLTPIDTQVFYKGQFVSSYSLSRALSRLTEYFAKITKDEAPYPWRAMTDKLDPILMEEWSSYLSEMGRYASELTHLSGYKPEEIRRIIDALVFPAEPHNFVIDKDRAEKIGIRISKSDEDITRLKVMKAWLTEYMLKESQKHIIRYLLPENEGGDNGKEKKAEDTRTATC